MIFRRYPNHSPFAAHSLQLPVRSSPPKESCLACGHCCGPYFALYAEEVDEERWASEGEREILERLDWERNHVTWDDDGAYNMKTGERFNRCYFLEKQPGGRRLCGIHHTKPVICRDYPPGSSEICALYPNEKCND